MTLNLNNPETILVFDELSGPLSPNEPEFNSFQIDGCEYSGSNIGFDLQMNRRRLILLGTESAKSTFFAQELDIPSIAENC